MSEFIYDPVASDFAALSAARSMEQQARLAEAMDGEGWDVEMEEGRDCLQCRGTGKVGPFLDTMLQCEHCHGRGWLKATSYEPQPLFSVREMQWGKGSAFGVRHDESGFWWPWRLATRARAQEVADLATCCWCEGEESILVEGFAMLEDE